MTSRLPWQLDYGVFCWIDIAECIHAHSCTLVSEVRRCVQKEIWYELSQRVGVGISASGKKKKALMGDYWGNRIGKTDWALEVPLTAIHQNPHGKPQGLVLLLSAPRAKNTAGESEGHTADLIPCPGHINTQHWEKDQFCGCWCCSDGFWNLIHPCLEGIYYFVLVFLTRRWSHENNSFRDDCVISIRTEHLE